MWQINLSLPGSLEPTSTSRLGLHGDIASGREREHKNKTTARRVTSRRQTHPSNAILNFEVPATRPTVTVTDTVTVTTRCETRSRQIFKRSTTTTTFPFSTMASRRMILPPLFSKVAWTEALSLLLLLILSLSIEATESQCGIYLANSTIPGAGLGMFLGHTSLQPNDLVTFGDVVIPLFEMDWHNAFYKADDQYFHLWGEYTWSVREFNGPLHDEAEDTETNAMASPGMGAALNCMLPIVNIEESDDGDSFHTSLAGVYRGTSPGAGSFSPYHDRRYVATRKIEPGAELYINYGADYFESRPQTYGFLPLAENYHQADRLLYAYRNVTLKVTTAIKTCSADETVNENEGSNSMKTPTCGSPQLDPNKAISMSEDLYKLMKEQSTIWTEARTLNALPANTELVEDLLQAGGTSMWHYNSSIRDLTWLQEHGQCMDNIRAGESTSPHAGRGAFATRFISKGGLVGPAPLIHLPESKILTMYSGQQGEDGSIYRNASNPIHTQLMLNYCFGHSESTLLLCPYGLLTSLINHHPTKPNTKIQWSREMRHPEWKTLPIDTWGKMYHNGLSFDFVALRDITEGEEIFIDYGPEWETAWQEHVAKYDPPQKDYTPAFELNKRKDLKIRTSSEQPSYEEDDGLLLFCRHQALVEAGYTQFGEPGALDDDGESGLYHCLVTERFDDQTYSVEIFSHYQEDKGGDEIAVYNPVPSRLPRDVFHFKDDYYKRDHYQPWSFRHAMMIPDDMFPAAWKNTVLV